MFHLPEAVEVAMVARVGNGDLYVFPLHMARVTLHYGTEGPMTIEAEGWPEPDGWRRWRPEDGSPVPESQGQIEAPQGALTERGSGHGSDDGE